MTVIFHTLDILSPGGERGHVIATFPRLINVTRCRVDGAQGQIEDW